MGKILGLLFCGL